MKNICSILFFFLFSLQMLSSRELTIWILPGSGSSEPALKETLKDFEAKSGYPVRIRIAGSDTGYEEIVRELTRPAGAALIQLKAEWLPFFAREGYLADMTGFSGTIGVNRFNHQAITSCTTSGSQKLYGLPWFMDVKLLFVNKKYADSINFELDRIKTYRGFREFLFRLKTASFVSDDGTAVAPFGFSGGKDPDIVKHFAYWIWSAGGDFIVPTPDGGYRSALFDENTIRGIFRYIYFTMDNLHSPAALDYTGEEIEKAFVNEHFGAIITDAHFIKELSTSEARGGFADSPLAHSGFYTFLIPSGLAGAISYIGPNNLVIPGKFASDPAARGLLAYLTGPVILDVYSRQTGAIPPDITLWKNLDSLYGYEAALQAAKTGRTFMNTHFWTAAQTVLASLFREIWTLVDNGTYSDRKLYELLLAADSEIRSLTGDQTDKPPLSLEAFTSVIKEYSNELKPIKETPFSSPLLLISLISILTIVFTASIFILLVIKMQKDHEGV